MIYSGSIHDLYVIRQNARQDIFVMNSVHPVVRRYFKLMRASPGRDLSYHRHVLAAIATALTFTHFHDEKTRKTFTDKTVAEFKSFIPEGDSLLYAPLLLNRDRKKGRKYFCLLIFQCKLMEAIELWTYKDHSVFWPSFNAPRSFVGGLVQLTVEPHHKFAFFKNEGDYHAQKPQFPAVFNCVDADKNREKMNKIVYEMYELLDERRAKNARTVLQSRTSAPLSFKTGQERRGSLSPGIRAWTDV